MKAAVREQSQHTLGQSKRKKPGSTALEQAVERFGRLETPVNNAGLMLLGSVVGADPDEWDRMIVHEDSSTTPTPPCRTCSRPPTTDAVAHIVNINSIAGRVAWNSKGVNTMSKFGVNGFTKALRQRVTKRNVRVGVLEPDGVDTELGSHNSDEIRSQMIEPFLEQTEVLAADDIADGVAYRVARPRHASIGGLWIMPTDQAWPAVPELTTRRTPMPLIGGYEPSTWSAAGDQVEFREVAGRQGQHAARFPVVIIITTTGRSSGRLRKTPVCA